MNESACLISHTRPPLPGEVILNATKCLCLSPYFGDRCENVYECILFDVISYFRASYWLNLGIHFCMFTTSLGMSMISLRRFDWWLPLNILVPLLLLIYFAFLVF